jgi:hypothetical protein
LRVGPNIVRFPREAKIDTNPNFDVSDWEDSRRANTPAQYSATIARGSTIIGAVLTLLMHGTAMTVLAYGNVKYARAVHVWNVDGASRTSRLPELLTLIDLPLPPRADSKSTMAAMTNMPSMLTVETEIPKFAGVDVDEPTEQDRLNAIYTRQIQARIERLWRRPRTPVGQIGVLARIHDKPFQCEIVVTQDPTGNVENVELHHCNGSEAWQHSLSDAVRGASPLPAPPNANTFSSSIALTFVSHSYVPGVAEDEYERPPGQYVGTE